MDTMRANNMIQEDINSNRKRSHIHQEVHKDYNNQKEKVKLSIKDHGRTMITIKANTSRINTALEIMICLIGETKILIA